MANLVVRNIEDNIVSELKARAGQHQISAEEEHRRILRDVLLMPKKRSFAEVICSIPKVGKDADFERVQDDKDGDVFS